MQQRFISLFKQLHSTNPAHHQPLQGFWFIHSDEPLISQWLIDACRPIWQVHDQTIKRIELSSAKSWSDVINELDTLSLFGDTSAIIVSGNHKPDKQAIDTLTHIAKDTPHHLLWHSQKQDKKSLSTKSLKLFDQVGLLIDGNLYDEKMRGELLRLQADRLNISLTPDAWQLLMTHTEQNLLVAYQNLWRLSLSDTAVIDAQVLMDCLIDGAEFSVFNLSDAVIGGHATKTLQILTHLKNTDTAPSLVLWAIAKDIRLILQIQAGKNPSELGIWSNKTHLYINTAHRSQGRSEQWLSQVYELDKMIKGVSDDDVWHGLKKLCLAVCKIDLMNKA
ncbi:DNA polymerase III subunit delta [Moraxella nasovis]|uniref:DNA polymerase III subunit delta n=1 Tax=Moraxella nasovis TaxID=2904121 RepID=UPI001F6164CC|nr:DNA polymerase III subunit delta [Moraxella nasovis]UNU72922.1 DNA polymerase III subunit delta [Moraxella nasovis]